MPSLETSKSAIHYEVQGEGRVAGLARRVRARRPDIETVTIPGASHLVHLDRPAEFVQAIRSASSAPSAP